MDYGFLLYSMLDMWRVILPLGLSSILVIMACQGLSSRQPTGTLPSLLSSLTYRCVLFVGILLSLVALATPWLLGSVLPESLFSHGLWSVEELVGYVLAALLLWWAHPRRGQNGKMSGMALGGAVLVLTMIGVMWVARWDMMGYIGHVADRWMVITWIVQESPRVIPKVVHMMFSCLVVGGMVICGLGLVRWFQRKEGSYTQQDDFPVIFDQSIQYGIGWMLAGLVPQILIGPWLFLVLDDVPRTTLIDGIGLSSIVFFVSVVASLFALVLLNASFIASQVKGLVWSGLFNTVLAIMLMGIIRHVMLIATIQSNNTYSLRGDLTLFHLLSIIVLTGCIGVIFVRGCVIPFEGTVPRSESVID